MHQENNNIPSYAAFNGNKNILLDLLDRTIGASTTLSKNSLTKENEHSDIVRLKNLKELVETDVFRILVTGEFSRGKSTLINALLGQDILPSAVRPTTAIVCHIKYGDKPKAIVFPKNLENNNEEIPKPFEIKADSLKEFITIPRMSNNEEVLQPAEIYDRMELSWPLDLCKNNVEIIDSPGLNDVETREQMAKDYLLSVDAVIFVMHSIQPVTNTEMNTIRRFVIPAGHDYPFFVFTYFDSVPDDERTDLKDEYRTQLAQLTAGGENHVLFVSALNALNSRINNDEELLSNSGIPDLETKLENFLTRERGRIKILRPAHYLVRILSEMKEQVLTEQHALTIELDQLQARVSAQESPINDLETKKDFVLTICYKQRDLWIEHINSDIAKFIETLADEEILFNKTREYLLEEKKSIDPLEKISIEEQGKRISNIAKIFLTNYIQDATLEFNETLKPRREEHLTKIHTTIEKYIKDFANQLKQIRQNIINNDQVPDESENQDVNKYDQDQTYQNQGWWERARDNLYRYSGLEFGAKASTRNALIQGSLITLAFFTGGFAAVTAGLVVISYQFLATFFDADVAEEKILKEMVNALSAELLENKKNRIKEIHDYEKLHFNSLHDYFEKDMNLQIARFNDDMNELLLQKKAGEKHIAKRRVDLSQCAEQIASIDVELVDLITEMA